MSTWRVRSWVRLAAVTLAIGSGSALPAQEAKSVPLAAELARVLEQRGLDSIAAPDPAAPDQFVAALFFPGSQLLVVSARYSVPQLLEEQIEEGNFREVYIDLNSASIPGTRIFISDSAADGLRPRRQADRPYDTVETGGRRIALNGDWRSQEMSEDEYMKMFRDADEAYARMLGALIEVARQSS